MNIHASNEQWQEALWPDRIMAPATLHSTASDARRALGLARDGTDHLPRMHGRLVLGEHVTTDWERFQMLAGSDDPSDWDCALGLIRGRPFLGIRSQDWVVLEGIGAAIESSVVDVACRFADHALENDLPQQAERAARRALRVSQFDERLWRVLLRSSDAMGNPAGVESAMRELLTLVAEEVEPYDAVHPETWALYLSLSRRSSLRRGA